MTIDSLSDQCIFKYNNYEKIIRSVAITDKLVSNSKLMQLSGDLFLHQIKPHHTAYRNMLDVSTMT